MIAGPLRASGLKIYDVNGDLIATCVDAAVAQQLAILVNAGLLS